MANTLSSTAITSLLQQYPQWQLVEGALQRDYQFEDFNRAFGFLCRVALLAEQADHHPTIWNSYNRLQLRLKTHETDSISERDQALLQAIEALQ